MDDDLTAAYFMGFHAAQAEMRELRAQNAELIAVIDYALEVSDEGLPLGERWKAKARIAIAKARGAR
jgi:hypothetical protein